ncbi:uncharacterized protein [Aristolochia californica]|uniref:uncharacterized protein n=1 Tax=Aristolochia californica TaxID=171875 RepID=UPI0035D74E27
MMEALVRSSALRVFSENCNGVLKSSSGGILGPAIRVLRLPKVETGASLVLRHKSVGSFPISCVSADSEAVLASEQTEIQATHGLRTVHVKFILQKACLFGEHFFLVGEDPIFGLWVPSNAVPLQWSEGHIWTAELDIPIGKSIQYKFILKGPSGEVEWQPGPDRVFQTWETGKIIVVTEDWENAELQDMREEKTTKIQDEESISSDIVLAESTVMMDETKNSENNPISLKQEENPVTITGEIPVLVPGLTPNLTPQSAAEEFSLEASTDEAIVDAIVLAESTVVMDETKNSENNPISLKQEENPVTITEEIPVLVPGLTPNLTPQSAAEEFSLEASMDEAIVDAIVLAESTVVMDETKNPENNPISLKQEENPVTITEEIPVLVPGLTPNLTPQSAAEEFSLEASTDEAIVDAVVPTEEANSRRAPERHENPTFNTDEPKAIDGTPPEESNDHDSSPREGVSSDVIDGKSQSVEISQQAPATDDVFGNDVQWGRKILTKLLLGMGFSKSQLS